MKQRAETKTDIERKIDQCNRRLALISDSLNELKAASADLQNWQRNLSRAENPPEFAASLIPCPPSAIARESAIANHYPAP
jgi:hypothetical protein